MIFKKNGSVALRCTYDVFILNLSLMSSQQSVKISYKFQYSRNLFLKIDRNNDYIQKNDHPKIMAIQLSNAKKN
jgi:hypothetical protein